MTIFAFISPYINIDLYTLTKNYFLIYFTIDNIFKILAEGFVRTKESYLRSSWNMFDFFVLVLSYLEIILGKLF